MRTRWRPIGLSSLGVRQERLSLGSNFRGAESFLGVAKDGAELARAILNGRSGHSDRATWERRPSESKSRCVRRLEEAWVRVDLAGVWQRGWSNWILIDKGEA